MVEQMKERRENIFITLKKYLFWANDFTPAELQEWSNDGDDLELVLVRSTLENEKDLLTPKERAELAKADKAIADTMIPETFAEFVKWYPEYPIRKWWSKKS